MRQPNNWPFILSSCPNISNTRLSNISVTFRTHNSVIYENCKLTILRCYNLTNILIMVIIRKIIQKILLQCRHGQHEGHPQGVHQVAEPAYCATHCHVMLIKKYIFWPKNAKTGNITLGEVPIRKNWCGQFWWFWIFNSTFWLAWQAIIFSTSMLFQTFSCVSRSYFHN